MKTDFTICNSITGQVLFSGSASPPITNQAQAGEIAVAGNYPADDWYYDIANLKMVRRSELILNITKENRPPFVDIQIAGVPANVEITWPASEKGDLADSSVADGSLITLSVDVPGVYRFLFVSPRHYMKEVTIEADPAT